jgi:hypothetical protein
LDISKIYLGYRCIQDISWIYPRYIQIYPDISSYIRIYLDISGIYLGYILDVSGYIWIYLYPDISGFIWMYPGFQDWGVHSIDLEPTKKGLELFWM